MRRTMIVAVLALATATGGYYLLHRSVPVSTVSTASASFGPGGGPGGGSTRLPMTVELASVTRSSVVEEITVVGNLIGRATVEAVPKVSGRLESVFVRLGDRVQQGERLAKLEDREILEQVKQAEASYQVSAATIRQREADLRLAQTNLDRSRSLFERSLIPKQTFDDTEARHQAAVAQLDLAQAQFAQAQARLDELKITLANTTLVSPVSGFVGKRALDPGAWVTPGSAFLSIVDIGVVRMIANVVEKDLGRIGQGMKADVTVDAYREEHFEGRIARMAPVLDPATRTAQIEVEVNNAQFRLKPGMYAQVSFVVERRDNTLVVPANAVVDLGGKKGVFTPEGDNVARFKPITVGLSDTAQIEVASGLSEGMRVVTTGAAALREGDRIVLLGQGQPGGAQPQQGEPGGDNRGQRGGPPGDGTYRPNNPNRGRGGAESGGRGNGPVARAQ